MLGWLADGTPVALLPDFMGYSYRDPSSGETIKIRESTAENISANAECFYRGFPSRPLKLKDLAVFAVKSISLTDMMLVVAASIIVSLLGMILILWFWKIEAEPAPKEIEEENLRIDYILRP